jgi:hypothetical protein
MIKALITKKVTLTAEPGSVVLISEGQFKALGDKAVAYKEEAKEVVEEIKEEPKKTSKKTSKGKKSED